MRLWLVLMRLGSHSGCHQMAERSFFIHGYQMPLCARCTGIVIGQLCALASVWFLTPSLWYALLLLPMVADGTTQLLKLRVSNNILRVVTGIIAGFGFFMALFFIFQWFIKKI